LACLCPPSIHSRAPARSPWPAPQGAFPATPARRAGRSTSGPPCPISSSVAQPAPQRSRRRDLGRTHLSGYPRQDDGRSSSGPSPPTPSPGAPGSTSAIRPAWLAANVSGHGDERLVDTPADPALWVRRQSLGEHVHDPAGVARIQVFGELAPPPGRYPSGLTRPGPPRALEKHFPNARRSGPQGRIRPRRASP